MFIPFTKADGTEVTTFKLDLNMADEVPVQATFSGTSSLVLQNLQHQIQ